MKSIAITLTIGLVMLLAAPAFADVEIRRGGSSWARIESDGTIRIGGSPVGKLEPDGTVRKNGSPIGGVESSGTIRRGGAPWGSASGCCGSFSDKRQVAAVLVFFGGWF